MSHAADTWFQGRTEAPSDSMPDADVTVPGKTMARDNRFGDAAHDVYWDDSVENRPDGSDA